MIRKADTVAFEYIFLEGHGRTGAELFQFNAEKWIAQCFHTLNYGIIMIQNQAFIL